MDSQLYSVSFELLCGSSVNMTDKGIKTFEEDNYNKYREPNICFSIYVYHLKKVPYFCIAIGHVLK